MSRFDRIAAALAGLTDPAVIRDRLRGYSSRDIVSVLAADGGGGGGGSQPLVVARVATVGIVALEGLQTIDGVQLQDGDVVLVWQDDDASANGTYIASSGEWARERPIEESQQTLVWTLESDTTATTLFSPDGGATPAGVTYAPIASYDWSRGTDATQVESGAAFVLGRLEVLTAYLQSHVQIFVSSEPADAEIFETGVAIWFDSTNGAASINFKGKTLNGTVVKASLPMAP